jgi:hypothetical protein
MHRVCPQLDPFAQKQPDIPGKIGKLVRAIVFRLLAADLIVHASIRIKIVGFNPLEVAYSLPCFEHPLSDEFEPRNAIFIFGVFDAIERLQHLGAENLGDLFYRASAPLPDMRVVEYHGQEDEDYETDQGSANVFYQTRSHQYEYRRKQPEPP